VAAAAAAAAAAAVSKRAWEKVRENISINEPSNVGFRRSSDFLSVDKILSVLLLNLPPSWLP
jgi:hypothetical protein